MNCTDHIKIIGAIHMPKPKHIPQRTYTRNGVIFKTVDGVRRKFGRAMNVHFNFSNELTAKDVMKHLFKFRYEQQLKLCEDSGYLYARELESIGFNQDDFIQDCKTIRIRFVRLGPLTDHFQLLNI